MASAILRLQNNLCYLYGLPESGTEMPQEDAYGYGGKEFTTTKGLNFYDFGARTYVPDECRFWQPDPMAGDYHWLSPYAYCAGDPINKIDPDGRQPSNYEAALMAQVVYIKDLTMEDLPDDLKQAGWQISHSGTSIKMNYTNWYENGLQSVLFERTTDGKTEYAYVFAGTNSVEDGIQDLAQLLGISTQYSTAICNATMISSELESSELTFVGHSLGGGEAAAASMSTGRAAITFNPAAVSPLTRYLNNLGSPSNIVNHRIIPTGDGKIRLGGCFVNNLQDNLHMSAPGKTIYIAMPIKNAFSAHSIDNFVDYYSKKH